jgi:hypothetical protein
MENTNTNTNINSISDIQTLINKEAQEILKKTEERLNNPKRIKYKPNIHIISKSCIKCKKEKKIQEFRSQKDSRDGHKNVCITCDDQYQKDRYLKLKSDIIIKVKNWQSKNKDKVSLYKKNYRLKMAPKK